MSFSTNSSSLYFLAIETIQITPLNLRQSLVLQVLKFLEPFYRARQNRSKKTKATYQENSLSCTNGKCHEVNVNPLLGRISGSGFHGFSGISTSTFLASTLQSYSKGNFLPVKIELKDNQKTLIQILMSLQETIRPFSFKTFLQVSKNIRFQQTVTSTHVVL